MKEFVGTKENKNKYSGKIFDSTSCGSFKVVEYVNSDRVLIEFIATGYRRFTSSGHIRSGLIKDPFHPYLYGRGFIGESHRENTRSLKAFTFWRHMMDRCYLEGYSEYYEHVEVTPEWYNFSNYKAWFDSNYIEGFEVDKDVLQQNAKSKIYSPNTCIFLPKEINCMFVVRSNKLGLPTGVRLVGSKYQARVKHKDYYIERVFTTVAEASGFYKSEKKKIIDSLAEKYRGVISDKAYTALLLYQP